MYVNIYFGLYNLCHTQIYRTYYYAIQDGTDPNLWYLYLPFIVRSLATGTAMKLFVHLRIPSQAFQGLLKNIKYVLILTKSYFTVEYCVCQIIIVTLRW